MKSFILITFSLMLGIFILPGCKKDPTNPTPTTVTIHDTLQPHLIYDTLHPRSNVLILTSHVWEEQEAYQDLSGATKHYIRGGENTTGEDQDILRLTFAAGGGGYAVAEDGTTQPLVWSFPASTDSTTMQLSISGVVFPWYFVSISDTAIIETTPLADGDLSSAKWVPVP